jgi:hypothetical protein
MCVAVFIAAEVPLPLIPHAGEDTMLCALELRPGEEEVGRAEIFCSAFFHASFVTVTRRPEQLRRA